jgi:hypothetical protein
MKTFLAQIVRGMCTVDLVDLPETDKQSTLINSINFQSEYIPR